MSDWISVKYPPKPGMTAPHGNKPYELFLIAIFSRDVWWYDIGTYNYNTGRWRDSFGDDDNNILFWQPIQKPPLE